MLAIPFLKTIILNISIKTRLLNYMYIAYIDIFSKKNIH